MTENGLLEIKSLWVISEAAAISSILLFHFLSLLIFFSVRSSIYFPGSFAFEGYFFSLSAWTYADDIFGELNAVCWTQAESKGFEELWVKCAERWLIEMSWGPTEPETLAIYRVFCW